jgi:hypothetical protein
MSFKIPKGKNYTFGITVLERNSFLPKDLADMDLANSSFSLVKLADLSVASGTITMARVADDKVLPGDPTTYLNGRISVTIPSTVTGALAYERGPKVDGYYLKPTYQGVATIKFTDGSSDIIAVVPDVLVVPVGV